jgi:group I intron endonuclease
MNKICCIYKITSPNNEIYIGQTINYKQRFNNYKNYKSKTTQKKIIKSFYNYGFENHKFDILIECDREKLCYWEKFYIILFNSFNNDYGLNQTTGGENYIIRNEYGSKISSYKLGKKRASFSQEWRDNISKSHKGMVRSEKWLENLKKAAKIRKNNNGYVGTEEQKEKFKISLRKFFDSPSGLELRAKNSELTRKRFSKPVLQYDLNGNYIREWQSARSVFSELRICHPQIINCVNGKIKSASGYIWKRKEEIIESTK